MEEERKGGGREGRRAEGWRGEEVEDGEFIKGGERKGAVEMLNAA